jgi:hypothetical protein
MGNIAAPEGLIPTGATAWRVFDDGGWQNCNLTVRALASEGEVKEAEDDIVVLEL